MQHVIWDWNGTLLNDIHVVIDAVNETVAPYGVPTLSIEDHARLFARPVSVFYERMLERPITAREWRELDDTFHDAYARRMPDARLSDGAHELLESLHENGTSQSLLSMAPHHHVTERAEVFGVARYMVRIDGLRDGSGALKEGSMLSHLRALLAHPAAPDDPSSYVVIGDSVDDAVAARANGVPAVMFASGSHARADLVATGFPVTDSLAEAIAVAGYG
ncbi:MAG: HAD family hydrolase [Acidimicrobiia bacterium]|nr:HAD family hydrolase [Acidimicrobiia bacterium]MDH5503152.1 HAD family hydrolase [Acidimicrobiia bacterium]